MDTSLVSIPTNSYMHFKEVDQGVLFLQNKLKENGLEDKVNIMIFSDHGMTNVSQSRVINLTSAIDINDIDEILDNGPNCYVWPKEGKVDKVLNKFHYPSKVTSINHMHAK